MQISSRTASRPTSAAILRRPAIFRSLAERGALLKAVPDGAASENIVALSSSESEKGRDLALRYASAYGFAISDVALGRALARPAAAVQTAALARLRDRSDAELESFAGAVTDIVDHARDPETWSLTFALGLRLRLQSARTFIRAGISPGAKPSPWDSLMPTSNRSVSHPCSARVSATSRTAECGPVRTVVWEGRSREAPPYPDQSYN
jgi:hypothetical protein